MMEKYNYKKVEEKWRNKWIDEGTFVPDLENVEDPYYALFMFPYPSAEGLHIGNFYAFTCVDVNAKFEKLRGRDVFEPFGFDAFGMHLENYALKIGELPKDVEKRTTKNFRKQVQAAGLSCDYTREVDTTHPEYYKWTQWIFTKLFEKGLAYQKKALLNWCPSCRTVLADEQIEGGVCERCKSVPEKKEMKQWFFRITDYAQRLLDGLDNMDWSDITKAAQRNWIGRSEGAKVRFELLDSEEKQEIEVFTTRPDTLFGASYFVLSPEHPLLSKIVKDGQKDVVGKYIKESGAKSDLERTESKEKTGVFTGAYVKNPVNKESLPIWVADYVLMSYGTGAIMAVPAHDQRDFDFAKKYDLPIKQVVSKDGTLNENFGKNWKEEYAELGIAVNSEILDGLKTQEAKKKILGFLEEKSIGERFVNFRLRDWCISRQRYWGPPVPIVYCEKCGAVSVPEKDLPVELPDLKEGWEPAGDGRGPLAKIDSFMKTTCPKCGGPAEREADVMDNFLDSAWYFFRYIDPHNNKAIFDKKLGKKCLPVDFYVGGNEHAVLHLMYTRFVTMALHDLGIIDFDNPFKKFRANGMILKDGKKMSKSKGNVINPEEYGEKVGYDALKTYLLFLGPLSEDRSFTDSGVQGTKRWVDKISKLQDKVKDSVTDNRKIEIKLNQTIKNVTEDFENQKYNTSIAKLMELTNELSAMNEVSLGVWKKFLALVAPFTPALAEEMWQRAGGKESIFIGKNWPEYDEAKLLDDEIEVVVQINGRLRAKLQVARGISKEEIEKIALKNENIEKHIDGKNLVKVIYVPGKLVNLVVR